MQKSRRGIFDHLGRVYGLVSITAEQLLIRIGHRLADRFFHTGERKKILQRCSYWLHFALCCPGRPLQLSPVASLSDRHHRGWVRYFEVEFTYLFLCPSGPKLSSLRRGQAGSTSIYFLPILSSMVSCQHYFFPHSSWASSSFQGQELEC